MWYRSTHRINIFHVFTWTGPLLQLLQFIPANMDQEIIAVLLAADDGILAVDDAVAAPNPLNAPEQQGKPPRVIRGPRRVLWTSQRHHRAFRMAATGR